MANQPPARPWFRLPSIARPAAPIPTPAPEPPPPQPRPAIARPAFRPVVQPQPQPVPTQPAPPPSAGITSVPTSPTIRPEGGVASVPTSPTPRATALTSSLPTSPAPASAPLLVTTASLPPSPTPKPVPTASSVPTSPAPKPAPSASVPPSPAPKPVTTTSVTTSPASKPITITATRVPSPEPPLIRTIKPAVQTPPQSPKPKPTAPPPSPLTLPPSQVKSDAEPEPKIPLVAEQKKVLVQKTIDKPKVSRLNGSDSQRDFVDTLNSSIAQLAKQEASKDVETKERGHRKKVSSDSEDVGMRVITIAGDNKGVFMEVIHSPKKHVFEGNSRFLHQKGNPRSDGSDWGSHGSSGEEGNIKKKDKNHKGRSVEATPFSAFMNSNVQGVNNSIICDSSCTHHDPGVRLALSRKPAGSGFHVKDRGANDYQS